MISSAPIAYDEGAVAKFWDNEPFDKALPPKGFVTDFVLALRGIESPTSYCAWSALWALSSILKREVWFKRFPKPLYPSLYITLVSPPRRCAKSTVIRFAGGLVESAPFFIEGKKLSRLKVPNLLYSKATPESFSMLLEPEVERIEIDDKGTIDRIERYPQLCMCVSEFTTLLGRQQYNLGLIDRLTDLYDNAISDDVTLSRGMKIFRDSYVTLIGGTQPDKLQKSLPPEAVGGGFLSRLMLVVEDGGARCFPHPRVVPDGPSEDELAQRLAWIAENAQGEYYLSQEAEEFYQEWYRDFHHQLLETTNSRIQDMRCRIDVHLLKLAMIIRAQRYTIGNEIQLTDIQAADKILQATYGPSMEAVDSIGASDDYKFYRTLRHKLSKEGHLTRRQVVKHMSGSRCPVALVNRLIYQLFQEGLIRIRRKGAYVDSLTSNGSELYIWTGGTINGKNEFIRQTRDFTTRDSVDV